MSEKIYDHELRILNALEEHCGRSTKVVAERAGVCGSNGHQRSGAARAYLMSLKKRGFVDFYDNDKPTLWKRTPVGTAALFQSSHEERSDTGSQQGQSQPDTEEDFSKVMP